MFLSYLLLKRHQFLNWKTTFPVEETFRDETKWEMSSSHCICMRTARHAFDLPVVYQSIMFLFENETQKCSRFPNILRTILLSERLQTDAAFFLLPARRVVFCRTSSVLRVCTFLIWRFLLLICTSSYNNHSDKNLCFHWENCLCRGLQYNILENFLKAFWMA